MTASTFQEKLFSLSSAKIEDEWTTRAGLIIRYGASDETFAREHIELGKDYLKQEDYINSMNEFNIVLSKIPSHHEALEYASIVKERLEHENMSKAYGFVLRGQEKFNKGDYNGAIEQWEKAIELMPEEDSKLKVKIECAKKLAKIKEKGKSFTTLDVIVERIGPDDEVHKAMLQLGPALVRSTTKYRKIDAKLGRTKDSFFVPYIIDKT